MVFRSARGGVPVPVLWLLMPRKITDLDPIEYDLLFERFLNPERVSMPDFDVDFCMDGRDKVIDYVAPNPMDGMRYLRLSPSVPWQRKRWCEMLPEYKVNPMAWPIALSKMIPFEIGMTLAKAYEQEEAIRDFLASDEEAAEIWEMALKLEGNHQKRRQACR